MRIKTTTRKIEIEYVHFVNMYTNEYVYNNTKYQIMHIYEKVTSAIKPIKMRKIVE